MQRRAAEGVDGEGLGVGRRTRNDRCWKRSDDLDGVKRERGVRRDAAHGERDVQQRRRFALLRRVGAEAEQRAEALELAAQHGNVNRRAAVDVVDVDVHHRAVLPILGLLSAWRGLRRRRCRHRCLRVCLGGHDGLNRRGVALLRGVVQRE